MKFNLVVQMINRQISEVFNSLRMVCLKLGQGGIEDGLATRSNVFVCIQTTLYRLPMRFKDRLHPWLRQGNDRRKKVKPGTRTLDEQHLLTFHVCLVVWNEPNNVLR